MFKLVQRAPAGGDCTAPYDVIFDKEYTVEKFVDNVLARKDEWGNIFICDKTSSCGRNYKHGYLMQAFPLKYIDRKIKSASAHGGWSMMNYNIELM